MLVSTNNAHAIENQGIISSMIIKNLIFFKKYKLNYY